ncbi:Primase C terminal 2 (PriCT-2) [Tangfeifania diversioriginum]|uniref:Primase C terminal 2 (PriCT-2) n=1 Tax=Tangfeifania diversioriginum TaxID=1168035 RepID=A0A1M6FD83_9BACT|nr:BT4734/BF3469 family protein [Tangfeifania diversioriginum]SHI95690.1 Primase C terminal 2 (PriCT-2) [Tangfeifania diversioriginum]
MKTPKFSYFNEPVTNTKPYKSITLADVYMVLTGHWFKQATEKLRTISDPDANRNFKAQRFPFVTFSGTFSTRKESGLIQHSGLITIDFDKLKDVETLKLQLLKDKHFETELLFTSPNGNGLKWIIPINTNGEYNHGQLFDAISRYIQKTYQIEVDKSGRDVARICFLCYDPDAFMHPRHGRSNRHWPGEIYTVERQKFNPGKWLNETNRKKDFKPVPFSSNMTRTQRDVETVLRRIENYQVDLTMNYEDWIRLAFAFADEFGETGRDYFHRVSRFYSEYNSTECDRQFDRCLKSGKSGVTIKSFFQAAKDAGINIRV